MAISDRVQELWNLEAERSLLGSMLLDEEAADAVIDKVTTQAFYSEAHRTIFDAIMKLRSEGVPIDLITVTDAMRSEGTLAEVGGASAISALANYVPTVANVEYTWRSFKRRRRFGGSSRARPLQPKALRPEKSDVLR